MAVPGRLYREGNTLKLQNYSGRPKLLIVEQFGFNHYLNNEIFQWIDTLAKTGVNSMRVFGFWPFGRYHEEEPYVKTGSNRYDLNRFNERYFDYLKKWIVYANDRGIFVQYELFDSAGFWQSSFAPFNPFYQIVRSDHRAFSDLNNRQLVEIQKRYIRKVINTVRPDRNLNLIIGIMNEFKGRDKEWHYMMSKYVHDLAPNTIISGSMEDSKAVDDPNTDIWAVHTGTYEFNRGKPHVPQDVERLRRRTGNRTILAYSTDGFGVRGMFRETPNDMRRLTQDINRAGLQVFSFLDQKAYAPSNPNNPSQSTWPGSVARLNVETYKAIVAEFRPEPLPTPKDPGGTIPDKKEVPKGVLDIFDVSRLPSTHKDAVVERGGKAIRKSSEHGFLCYGQYKSGYPQKPLKVYFSMLIDNNSDDDRNVLIPDVYDHHSDRVLGKRVITRKDFAKADEFCLFEFDFIPPSAQARMEFRIYYMGGAYLLANRIVVVDPAKVSAQEIAEFLKSGSPGPITDPDEGEGNGPEYCSGNQLICLPVMTSENVSKHQGRDRGGNFQAGQYTPAPSGGIEFPLRVDLSGNFVIEFEIEGNIPNWHKGEHDGGKPSLFTMEALDGSYYLNLQRMYVDYRGGGLFRILFGPRSNNTVSLVTHRDISGHYSMKQWGNERHHFQIMLAGQRCQLKIDDYESKWATAPAGIGGQKQVRFILGNRELSRLGMGQGVETRFQRVKIRYI